ncbi:hypothetical protein [Hugenholtzia roseola]|uniref:hypothetical protein n=1 Tax=Hugenholtzia roseola TaxID=1002 RepID=UPI0012B64D26|nr:hypothetical protein [Hugenholtzia roseola]
MKARLPNGSIFFSRCSLPHTKALVFFGFGACFSFLVAFLGSFQNPIKTNEWVLWQKREGVEFYVKHGSSSYDSRYNTHVKLRNTNSYEVTTIFIPTYECNQEPLMSVSRKEVRVNIYPRHSVTLLADRPCNGFIPNKVLFEQLKIQPR